MNTIVNESDRMKAKTQGAWDDADATDDGLEPDFKPLTPEQAAAWRQRNPVSSPWRVLALQVLVGVAVAVLLASGGWMFGTADLKLAPRGWHAMAGLGTAMCLIFAHLYFAPFKRLGRAVHAKDWPAAGKALKQIHPLVLTNFALGWAAVLAVQVWR